MSSEGKKRKKKRGAQKDLSGLPTVVPAPGQLQVVLDGVSVPFADYTRNFTRTFYPEYAKKTIMIPPLKFYDRKTNLKAFGEASGQQDDLANSVLKNVKVQEISDSSLRGEAAEYLVTKRLKDLADREGWKVAIICSAKFENYLNKLGKSVGDVKKPLKRGEHDLLVVHPQYGVIVVCVKSVGSNFAALTPGEVTSGERERRLTDVLTKVIIQMEKEVANVQHVLSDLSPPVSLILALPCVPRHLLMSVLKDNPDLREKIETSACLCLEELPPLGRRGEKKTEHCEKGGSPNTSSDDEKADSASLGDEMAEDLWHRSKQDADCPGAVTAAGHSSVTVREGTAGEEALGAARDGSLSSWFERWSQERSLKGALTEEQYLEIVGRYCCLYSTVEIPSKSKCEGRIEVRVMSEAVAEVDVRFRALILHKFQTDLLLKSSRHVYMHGVMGSGKSVMLMLKARYWLAQSCNVVIINVSYDVEGSPIGHALLQAVNESLDGNGSSKLAKMVNIKLTEFNPKAFLDNLNFVVPEKERETTHFCLDEVYANYQKVFESLRENFPDSEIWAAGLDGANAPPGFEQVEMTRVLRCPPTVQRVLKVMDYSDERIRHYTICGAKEGLPAEGPEPKFIFHEDHGQLSRGVVCPLHCQACAGETVRFLQEVMDVAPARGEESTPMEVSEASSLAAAMTTNLATNLPPSLKIRDVALLCKDPTSDAIYSKVEDVYKLDTGRFDKFNDTLENSAFVTTLRQRGYPVRIVRSSSSKELAASDEEAITASWVNPASGLEWAVVIYMPGDPAQDPVKDGSAVEKGKVGTSSAHQYSVEDELGPEDQLDAELRRTRVRMTKEDCEYLFWSASRCTAQLVVMVP